MHTRRVTLAAGLAGLLLVSSTRSALAFSFATADIVLENFSITGSFSALCIGPSCTAISTANAGPIGPGVGDQETVANQPAAPASSAQAMRTGETAWASTLPATSGPLGGASLHAHAHASSTGFPRTSSTASAQLSGQLVATGAFSASATYTATHSFHTGSVADAHATTTASIRLGTGAPQAVFDETTTAGSLDGRTLTFSDTLSTGPFTGFGQFVFSVQATVDALTAGAPAPGQTQAAPLTTADPGSPPGSFAFTQDLGDVAGLGVDVPLWFDPPVVTGYDYHVEGSTFAAVFLPVGLGDDLFDLVIGSSTLPVAAGEIFDFVANGFADVSMFGIRGIDPGLMLDPSDLSAFPTGLTFDDADEITLTMTPIAVPEPASALLLCTGLVALSRRGRPGATRA